jgi:hypothetical protein
MTADTRKATTRDLIISKMPLPYLTFLTSPCLTLSARKRNLPESGAEHLERPPRSEPQRYREREEGGVMGGSGLLSLQYSPVILLSFPSSSLSLPSLSFLSSPFRAFLTFLNPPPPPPPLSLSLCNPASFPSFLSLSLFRSRFSSVFSTPTMLTPPLHNPTPPFFFL